MVIPDHIKPYFIVYQAKMLTFRDSQEKTLWLPYIICGGVYRKTETKRKFFFDDLSNEPKNMFLGERELQKIESTG